MPSKRNLSHPSLSDPLALKILALSHVVHGAFVKTQEQMLVLRFMVGLGVGGVRPNAVALFAAMGGSYPRVGATCGLIDLLGLTVIWWAPETTDKKLQE